jgi:hypothetical protein
VNVSFAVADASRLPDWQDGTFDAVTLVLALHEMPGEARLPVLRELRRVGRRLVVLDYAVPLPRGFAGLVARAVEMGNGPRRFAFFLDYLRGGGLDPLLAAAGFRPEHAEALGGGALTLRVVRSPPAAGQRRTSFFVGS